MLTWLITLTLLVLPSVTLSLITDESSAWQFYESYGEAASLIQNSNSKLSWAYATDITDEHQQATIDYADKVKEFNNAAAVNASLYNWQQFSNSTLRRAFREITDLGTSILNSSDFTEYNTLSAELESIYGKAYICDGDSKKYQLEPELTELLASNRNYDTLLWAWKGWRDATGPLMKDKYARFTELMNKAAVANGYADAGASWRSRYEAPGVDFRDLIEKVYVELKPLYQEVHTYVRHKLKQVYGESNFPASGHIPAHILGNMWAQSWTNIESLVLPFSDVPTVNATPALQQKSVVQMFEMADKFFTDLGLEPVTQQFWDNSMLEKPTDGRDVICHASAWDFHDGQDFRIKQCTRKTMDDFVTVHHEMGHIQYYLQYKDLHYLWQTGANPGFHEAVGDVLALSVATPKHLKEVNLIDNYESSHEADINFLLSMALDKIVFLPFGKLMDDYRWSIFEGQTTPEDYNNQWWANRCKYQGLSSPVERGVNDFDAGAKYHIPANVPYVRYFVSFVLQFQFHEALCAAANQTGPLHTCDINASKEAGKLLGDMLKRGRLGDWPDALEAVTGNRTLSAAPIIEYFRPLITWLKEFNNGTGETSGWSDDCPSFPKAEVRSSKGTESNNATVFTSTIMLLCSALLSVIVLSKN